MLSVILADKKPAAGSTIERRIPIFHFDDENVPCCVSGRCEVYRSSPLFIPQSTTILIRSVISAHVKNSNTTEPLLSPSGVNFVPHKFTPLAANRDWFELV